MDSGLAVAEEDAASSATVDRAGTAKPVTRLTLRGRDEDDLLSSQSALIAGSDVADSPRDSARRYVLAAADILGIVVAYLAVWAVHPPAGDVLDRLPLLG